MTCGIYLLQFNNTDKVYIGKSKNIEKRYREHLSSFASNTASTKLMDAYIRYGIPAINVLKTVSEENLNTEEQSFIYEFDSVFNGFNSSPFSSGGGAYGEDCSSSIYTNDQYISVFKELISNLTDTYETIASKHNVSKQFVSGIASGTRGEILLKKLFPTEYKELSRLIGKRKSFRKIPQTTSKYNIKQYIEVIKLLAYTENTHNNISIVTGVNTNVIRDISSCRRHRWLMQSQPNEWNILINKSKKEK